MPISIHGKDYKTVAERLNEAHEAKDLVSVNTEVLYITPQIIVKATIVTKKGTYTGISGADPTKAIEKKTPVEVAETSAVGRALAFAGYAGSEIASAEELQKAFLEPSVQSDPVSKLVQKCTVHNEDMHESISKKTGNPYFSHQVDGKICFGKGTK